MRVLITGASSGIGFSIAKYLDDLGYDLVLVSRNEKRINELSSSFKNNVDVCVMDISDINNCKLLHDKYCDVDIVINNAGFGLFGEFVNTDIDKEMNMLDVNVRALHVLTKLYLGDMIKRDDGHILNVCSIAGFMPGPLMSTYYASKSYVLRLSQGIREELRRNNSNVKIHVLCPGPVKTNFDDIAGVSFSLKGMESDYVAKYAIDNMLKNKFIIIPGFNIKLLRFISKVMPDSFLVKMVYSSQKRKGKE